MTMLKEVTKEEFFKAIGPLDVHPRTDEASLKTGDKIRSIFETRVRVVVGETIGSYPNTKFYLVAKN